MSVEKVKNYFSRFDKDKDVIELATSSATVDLAAQALNVIPARIAKTLSFKADEGCILVVTAGDGKIDNKKFKETFNLKAKMLSADEVIGNLGYAVGGVCPFAIENPLVRVFCDVSMKRFDTVFPACGSSNSAIELTCDELFKFSKCTSWVDVCKGWD